MGKKADGADMQRGKQRRARMDMAGQDGLNHSMEDRPGTFIFISKENPIEGF